MTKAQHWLIVFFFLFGMASIGVFLMEYGTTENLFLSLGMAISLVSSLLAGLLIVYLASRTEGS
jgi:ABC-type transport system involved in multi-copper enzyme maturation permease subunit